MKNGQKKISWSLTSASAKLWFLTVRRQIWNFKLMVKKFQWWITTSTWALKYRTKTKQICLQIILKRLLRRQKRDFIIFVLTYQKYFLKSFIDIPKCLRKLTAFEEKLESLQIQALKTLIGSPKSTSPAIVRLFPGSSH